MKREMEREREGEQIISKGGQGAFGGEGEGERAVMDFVGSRRGGIERKGGSFCLLLDSWKKSSEKKSRGKKSKNKKKPLKTFNFSSSSQGDLEGEGLDSP